MIEIMEGARSLSARSAATGEQHQGGPVGGAAALRTGDMAGSCNIECSCFAPRAHGLAAVGRCYAHYQVRST